MVAAHSAKTQREPQTLADASVEQNTQQDRQTQSPTDIGQEDTQQGTQESARALPESDEVSELKTTNTGQQGHLESATSLPHIEHQLQSCEEPEHVSPLSDFVKEPGAVVDAASPASSSEDAPGSDYDDFVERTPVSGLIIQTRPHLQQPLAMLPPAETISSLAHPRHQDHPSESSAQAKQEESGAVTKISSQIPQVPRPIPLQLSPPTEPNITDNQHVDDFASKNVGEPQYDRYDEAWSLRVSALLGEIEERSAATAAAKGDSSTHEAHKHNTQVPTSKPPQPEADISNEQPVISDLLTRKSENDGGSSSKRQKLNDSVSTSVPTIFFQSSTFIEVTRNNEGNHQAKTKVPPKLRASSKSNQSKAKPKKASKHPEIAQKQANSDSSPNLGSNPDPHCAADPEADPTQGTTVGQHPSLERGIESQARVTEAQPKKTRKTPARLRKRSTKAGAPQEGIQSPLIPNHAAIVGPNVVGAVLSREAIQCEAAEATSAVPALLKVKSKGEAKPKVSSRAKNKLEAEPTEFIKPPPKRSLAKKTKDPVARLLPAQADGSISELELEPSQHSPGVISLCEVTSSVQSNETISEAESCRVAMQSEHGASEQGDLSAIGQQRSAIHPAPISAGGCTSSNIFASMPPPLYPAQAYYPTRAEFSQHQNRGLSTLTSAASMLDSDMHWSESSAIRRGSSSSGYDAINECTSPTTVANTAGSMAGDAASDATSLSPDQSIGTLELDPKIYPPGWRPPNFDLMDPDTLMTSMRERTVWTFWDCYLPIGCRDQDMVILSNDGIAFPCAAWNPCLFSTMLKRVIKNPSRHIRHVLQRDVDENRRILGYAPLPCVWIDESWHATNLLLSFLHPIPAMFLPDRATCRIVLDLGMRFGVERAFTAATQRLFQLEEEDRASKAKHKGKARSTEEEIAADLAERAAQGSRE